MRLNHRIINIDKAILYYHVSELNYDGNMLQLDSCAHELREKYCAKVVGATSSKGFLARTVRS